MRKMAKVKKVALSKYFENAIAVQKVLTGISEKLDTVTKQLSEVLELFNKAADSFAETQGISERKIEDAVFRERMGKEKEEENLLKKLDSLIDQNKTIAKGIILMEQKIREKE